MNNAEIEEKAYLRVIHRSDDLPEEFVIDKVITTIGRHPANDVCLPFSSVSRFHSRIEEHEGQFHIIDRNSSNGTYVNGRRITESVLNDGDILIFGSVELQFTLESLAEKVKRGEEGETTEVEVITTETQYTTTIRSQMNVEATPLPGAEAELLDRDTLIKAHSRLATLYKLSDILRSVGDEQEMLRRVLNLIFDVLPADRGAILLSTDDKENPLRAAVVKQRHALVPPQEIPVSKTIIERCMSERIAILSRDALTDKRFGQADSIVEHDIRSTMCVPLIVQNKVIGIVHVDTKEFVRAFSEEDLAFLTSLANELAVSIEHLRLREEIISKERLVAIGETITGIAHNIKNMLLVSKGGCDLMDRSIARNSLESVKESWGIIKSGLDKISAMVHDMLEFSRRRQVIYKECNINDTITHLAHSLSDELKKKNIQVKLEFDPKIKSTSLNEDGLHKALLNLIVNAIEAIQHSDGEITLKTHLLPDNSFMIKIGDNGSGIPQKDLPKIFHPFFTTKGAMGIGLGLPITKKIIEEMGGRITVESEVNKGTTFTLILPSMETRFEDAEGIGH